jgi:DNA-binding NtrC family response regulator
MIEWIGVLTQDQIEQEGMKWLVVDMLRDFLLQPLEPHLLSVLLDQAFSMAEIEQALRHHPGLEVADHFGLIGESPGMRDVLRRIQLAAEADVPVLITGDTGTGKELVARALHQLSPQASGPFVALNCAAIPRDLLLSELFGNEEGAFTGASQARMGLIQTAHGGILLLDEIGEMPPASQGSLLRVIEEKRVTPVGSTNPVDVDVRFLATTNRNLEEQIRNNGFRADLYYRLAIVTIRVPPLRERTGDIEALANHFLRQASRRTAHRIVGFSEGALDALRRSPWPGNVRELKNCILQSALTCSGRFIKSTDLQLEVALSQGNVPHALENAVHNTKREFLLSALARNSWNVSESARDLEVSRSTMYRLMAKHGIAKEGDARDTSGIVQGAGARRETLV